MPKPNCTEEVDVGTIKFGRLGRRVVEGRFDGCSMTGHGGVMLLGEVDRKLALIEAASRCIKDPLSPLLIKHAVRDMLRQRAQCVALGWWEDSNLRTRSGRFSCLGASSISQVLSRAGNIDAMLVSKMPLDVEALLAEQPRPRKPTRKAKSVAVAALADSLDANFFKVIAEPVRQQIVLILLQEGRSNVQEVAKHLVQDRSVVSRHLAILEQASFARSYRVQRFTEYELNGPAIIAKLERLLLHLRTAAQLCCPPDDGSR